MPAAGLTNAVVFLNMSDFSGVLRAANPTTIRRQAIGWMVAWLVLSCGETDETVLLAGQLRPLKPLPSAAVETADRAAADSSDATRTADEARDSSEVENTDNGLRAALSSPQIAQSVCRWQATAGIGSLPNNAPNTTSGAPPDEGAQGVSDCEARLAQCQFQEAGVESGSAALASATTIATALPQLLVSDNCSLPPSQVDLCAAELLGFLAPAFDELTCEQPQLELPPINLTVIAQLPTCFLMVLACPELLPLLANFAEASQ